MARRTFLLDDRAVWGAGAAALRTDPLKWPSKRPGNRNESGSIAVPGCARTGVLLCGGPHNAELQRESGDIDGDARLEIQPGVILTAGPGLTRLAVIEITQVAG